VGSRIDDNFVRSLENRIELVGPTVSLDPSRIDELESQAEGTTFVVATADGGLSVQENFYRTGTFNDTTKVVRLTMERAHGLDFHSSGEWWCEIGDRTAYGPLTRALVNLPDDNTAVQGVGGRTTAGISQFLLDNIHHGGLSAYTRIRVKDTTTGNYKTVVPTADNPVTAWLWIHNGSVGHPGNLNVALSHSQLAALVATDSTIDWVPALIDTTDGVYVDLDLSQADLND